MTKQLPVGTYHLTADVPNPKPDRRVKGDWTKLPVWEKGTMLIALQRGRRDDPHIELSLVGDRYARLHGLAPWDDGYELLVPALEHCAESLDALFTRLDVPTPVQDFFRFMVESKRWCPAQIEMMWAAYQTHLFEVEEVAGG